VNSKLYYKISGIVAIAVVAAIVGTLAFTSYEISSDSNTQTQSIGIGAYVTVEAYHEDGTLFQKWEGHNVLTGLGRNALVSCITGLDTTPFGFSSCDLSINKIELETRSEEDNGIDLILEEATISLIPEGCNPSNDCTGWDMVGMFDFDTLDCTPTVDCFKIINVRSSTGLITFNAFIVEPNISIVPNDRVAVTMTFDVPR